MFGSEVNPVADVALALVNIRILVPERQTVSRLNTTLLLNATNKSAMSSKIMILVHRKATPLQQVSYTKVNVKACVHVYI